MTEVTVIVGRRDMGPEHLAFHYFLEFSRYAKLDPPDNFHLFRHLLVTEVRQFVLVRESAKTAVADNGSEEPLKTKPYAFKEADG